MSRRCRRSEPRAGLPRPAYDPAGAPRAYIRTLLPAILAGQVNPGQVFDSELDLDHTPQGYQDMDARRALKVLIRP